MRRIEIDPKQNVVVDWWDSDQGINAIEIDGNRLKLIGWYDGLANWITTVELTPEQRRELGAALDDLPPSS